MTRAPKLGILAAVLAAAAIALIVYLMMSEDQEPPSSQEELSPTTSAAVTTSPPSTAEVVEGVLTLSGESGHVLTGIHMSNPDGNCVEIKESSDVVIEDSEIGPCGGHAVTVDASSSVRIEGNTFTDSQSGVYAHASESISVVDNEFNDAGRNFVQFDKVSGAGNEISNNRGDNQLGDSDAEDFVSIYQSGGTPDSPLLVVDNEFSGGGPSTSGSGIMVGDGGGSHIVVTGNVLTSPGQVGIGVAGGNDIVVADNTIYSATHPWSNVGIYVWNQSDDECEDVEVRDNRVDWSDSDGSPNPSWDSGDCGNIVGWDDNEWNADLG